MATSKLEPSWTALVKKEIEIEITKYLEYGNESIRHQLSETDKAVSKRVDMFSFLNWPFGNGRYKVVVYLSEYADPCSRFRCI